MSKPRSTCLYLLLINLVSFSTFGQGEWPLQHIGKRAGLSNSAINAVYFDQYDHVWFGTWDGLNRYDGDAITTFKPIADDKHSLSNNVIRQIIEDQSANLWIVTHNGINRYDRKLNRFDRYLHDIEGLPFLENNLQVTLSTDSSIYISLVGWGIAKYVKKQDIFIRIRPELNHLKNILAIGEHDHHLYLLDTDSLYFQNADGTFTSQTIKSASDTRLFKFITLAGRYFLIYQSTPRTLSMLELSGGKVAQLHEIKTPEISITTISPSLDQKQLYLGTDEGSVFLLKSKNESFLIYSQSEQVASLQEKKLKIFSIHESKQNILWIGTDGDGIYKYLTKKRTFHTIAEGDPKEGKISNSIVRSLFADENKLYIGTRSGGLNILDKKSGITKIYDKSNGLSDNTVLSLTKDKIGNLWIGLDGEGLDFLEKKSGKIFHFPRDFKNLNEEISFGSVYKIFIDSYGHLWLGTSGYGIVYLDIKKTTDGYMLGEAYTISPEQGALFGSIQLKSSIIYSIEEQEANILWFGSRNGGLYRFNALTRNFTHKLYTEAGEPFALSNNDILSLHLDHKNQLWVGTSGGLNKVNLSNYSVEQYTHNNGLANNTIHGILEDYTGSLWLSSNNGLFVFNPEQNTFKNFNWSDGLLNYEYTDGAFFQGTEDKRLIFGGTNGVDIVYPDRLDTIRSFPSLALTDLYISNNLINPGDSSDILQSSIDLQKQIDLNYDQNFLSIRFTTLDYWHKQRCGYRYYLEGFDKGWIDLGKKSDINLTNIPPGQYTLHLNNTNENGNWNPQERTLAIQISPPWWATNTAYFIYILLALFAQFGLILILKNRAKQKKAEEIDRLKQEQSEVIQKYKLEFFTNIAHEFRTPLTLILGPAATLLEKTKANASINLPIQTIYRNSLRLQKLIQELIQFRKVELGKEKLKVRSLDLTDFVEEILQSFRQYALDKEIVLTYETPKSLMASIDPEILEKILINVISNALKYSDHDGAVHIKIWEENDRIYFSIKDKGVGIHPEELHRIFERFSNLNEEAFGRTVNSAGIGLSLTRKLILLHQGDIDVQSMPGKGTNLSFWLPKKPKHLEQVMLGEDDHAKLDELDKHIKTELFHKSHLDQEMINISLERFERNVLIVDDNIEILSLLKGLLSSKYNVISCTNGQDALNTISHRKIDLVVSDVIMPEMNGFTLCKTIKSRIETSHIPVILLTAKGEIEERIEGLGAGADAYIPKPFHPDHLQVRIEKLIEMREGLMKKFNNYPISESKFSSFGIGSKDDEFFKQLDSFLKSELGNTDLDAQYIASHVGISKTSLYKKIRALTGQTPHWLINQYRLKQAAFLLTNTELNVSEIINKTGFNSRSYFYKSFQEMFHCSPSNYARNQN